MTSKTTIPFENFELSRSPGHLLRRCHQRSHEIFHHHAGEFDLTRQQFAMLLAVFRHPGASVQDMADLTAVDRNTLVGIVQRLVAKGLVKKQRSSRDARAYELEIQASGIDLLERMEESINEVQDKIFEPLSDDEREIFILCAQKLSGIGF
ncbi:MarR family winged helix-turn-helix transcriptional regulator [Sphingomonas hengshuiensis]|uniref:MarR family winged helix-turn-helix transcriptional regulator n=1 Tax=Sphingomonas hengshuiensis TaxID=1609977 RepID=UPI000980C343|nr:MarR family transcriptional regulator [Sphingomonas hengshuiensis]